MNITLDYSLKTHWALITTIDRKLITDGSPVPKTRVPRKGRRAV